MRAGSSPLARGLRPGHACRRRSSGIIPARAGFTCRPRLRDHAAGDHPRSRGVYCDWPGCEERIDGSSPLARGLQLVGPSRQLAHRIIPARAGFTHASRPGKCPGRDHPRSRGVYTHMPLRRDSATGSSPLARGLPEAAGRPQVGSRIIPARAGFTPTCPCVGTRRRDHPRSRGVYHSSLLGEVVGRGSSPLARGLLEHGGPSYAQARIIPARAGFTVAKTPSSTGCPDHPRSRGVYGGSWDAASRPRGSSPLARGLRRLLGRGVTAPGIIPARAGFTMRRPPAAGCSTDHPRSRGVYQHSLQRN